MTFRPVYAALLLSMFVSLRTVVVAADVQSRTWTDATGVFTVDATFVEFADGLVHLKRSDGKSLKLSLDKLSASDQAFVRSRLEGSDEQLAPEQLSGKPVELKNDDDQPAGKKSFPRGIAAAFDSPGEEAYYMTSVRVHGGRYGLAKAPREDFHVSLCDKEFNLIKDFKFPYSKFKRGESAWVELRVEPTKVPREFVICLNFNPTRTKGVYVSHDADGSSLVGLPEKMAGRFTGGDWMIRVSVDRSKAGT